MSKGRKDFVNPYLFLLAKRLLEYDFVQLAYEPSDLELAGFIYDRYKSSNYSQTKFTDPLSLRDSFASSRANSIYQKLLKPKDFNFTEKKLDEFVQEIRVLYTFRNWNDFYYQFCYDDAALAAKITFYNGMARGADLQIYQAHINKFLISRHIERIRCDNDYSSIFAIGDSSIIRSASNEQIRFIAEFEQQHSELGCELIAYLSKLNYKDSLPLIYSCIDSFKLMRGYLIFIPLKDESYIDLRKGNTFYHFLKPEDVLELNSFHECRYCFVKIYYEALGHGMIKTALNSLEKKFVNTLENNLIFGTSFPPKVWSDAALDLGFSEEVAKFPSGISFHETPIISFPTFHVE